MKNIDAIKMINILYFIFTVLILVSSCVGNIDDREPEPSTRIIELKVRPTVIRINSEVELEVVISDSLNIKNYEFTWVLANSEIRTTDTTITVWNTPETPAEYEIGVLVVDSNPETSDPSKIFYLTVIE